MKVGFFGQQSPSTGQHTLFGKKEDREVFSVVEAVAEVIIELHDHELITTI